MPKTLKRPRRPSYPKGEYTPPVYVRKRLYRAVCKERAAIGMTNDAGTGLWRDGIVSVSSKSKEFSMGGSKHRGGSTPGGPKPNFVIYEKKLQEGDGV
jgi:hypothetical protein